ncbi:MAG: CmpA/NrtA family ABC transporter substrate-binding protein [Litoreibacter sp.]
MKTTQVQCGYLPLVDSAPLILAKELKFAAEEGLELILKQQPSWSALRDRLAFGHLDFAHMLSPMPIAMSLGLGLAGSPVPVDALMVLSVNGTVIGVSTDLHEKMRRSDWTNNFDDPDATARAIFANAPKPLRIGVPFPFSMHRMLLEYWLSRHPEFASDVEIVTVPPPQMADAMRDGILDMFCVGEPWGSVAMQRGDAVLILPGERVWQFAPEKVLGARHDWIAENADTCGAMMRAIYKASEWMNRAENIPLAIEILTQSQHLNLSGDVIEPALSGNITPDARGAQGIAVNRFLSFHSGAANFPWRSQACWIADRLATWHGLNQEETRQIARGCFRCDLFRDALNGHGVDMPGASEKVEGALPYATAVASTKGQMILGPDTFFDGALFDFGSEKTIKK